MKGEETQSRKKKDKKETGRKRRKVLEINATSERWIITKVDQNAFPFASWGKFLFLPFLL